MEVSKNKARKILGITRYKLEQKIKNGELLSRKEPDGDWLITVPDAVTPQPKVEPQNNENEKELKDVTKVKPSNGETGKAGNPASDSDRWWY